MTQEDYERLKSYEQELKYAVRMNFMSMPQGKFNEIMAIYKDVYGTELSKAQRNCSTCRLNALKRLGNDYFAHQQEYAKKLQEEAQKAEEIDVTDYLVEPAPKKTTKKAGRPKKINLDGE